MNTENYFPPCQIEVIWLKEPEFQTIIHSRFRDRPDEEIIINGPYDGDEYIESVDSLLKQPRWTMPLPKEGPFIYSEDVLIADVLGRVVAGQMRTIENSVFQKVQRPMEFGGQIASWESFAHLYAGNIADTSSEDIVSSIVKRVKSEEEKSRTQPTQPAEPQETPPQDKRLKAHTTFFCPPFIIGPIPKPQGFKEILSDVHLRRYEERVVTSRIGGFQVSVHKDWQIIVTADKKDHATRILNAIFAVSALRGTPSFAVREFEIGEAKLEPDDLTIRESSIPMGSARTLLFEERWPFRQPSIFSYRRKEVSEKQIFDFIETAERILKHRDKTEQLHLWLETYTHFRNSEFPESFVVGWIIVERFLSRIWEDFLRDKGVYGERESKLTSPGQWSIDYVIETLNLSGTVTDDQYKLFMDLKGKRNSFVHRGRSIRREDAENCLELATKPCDERFGRAVIADFPFWPVDNNDKVWCYETVQKEENRRTFRDRLLGCSETLNE